jgi:hypothetical protein
MYERHCMYLVTRHCHGRRKHSDPETASHQRDERVRRGTLEHDIGFEVLDLASRFEPHSRRKAASDHDTLMAEILNLYCLAAAQAVRPWDGRD